MSEDNNEELNVKSVERIRVEDGDAIVVTLPQSTEMMPQHIRDEYIRNIQKTFEDMFNDKKVRVLIVPYGMKVELITTSDLEDKEDA